MTTQTYEEIEKECNERLLKAIQEFSKRSQCLALMSITKH